MACKTRFVWNLCNPSSFSLWVAWAKLNLLHKDQFWVAKVPRNCSCTWRKLLKMRDKLRPFISMRVGNGCHTSLWFEAWMPRGPICSMRNARVIYDSGLSKDALVKDIIVDGRWRWPVANSPTLLDLKKECEDLPPPNLRQVDVLMWQNNGFGAFSTTEVWKSLRTNHQKVPWFPIVWFKNHIPRHSFVLWLAVKRKLATQDRLVSFGLLSRMSCLFCRHSCEDHDHLFFSCPFTARIWYTILLDCGFQASYSSWGEVLEWALTHFRGTTLLSLIGKLALATCVYVIWKERNKRKHENCYLDEVFLIKSVKNLV